jgi:hypothetical protein
MCYHHEPQILEISIKKKTNSKEKEEEEEESYYHRRLQIHKRIKKKNKAVDHQPSLHTHVIRH